MLRTYKLYVQAHQVVIFDQYFGQYRIVHALAFLQLIDSFQYILICQCNRNFVEYKSKKKTKDSCILSDSRFAC